MQRMRSSIVVLTLVLSVGLIAGCKKTTPTPQATNDMGMEHMEQDSDRMMSPMAMLAGGKKMKCTMTAEREGKSQSTTLYVDGKSYRTETQIGTTMMSGVFDGSTFYAWGAGTGKGTKMSADCLEKFKQMAKDMPQMQQSASYRSSEELVQQPDVDCSAVASIDLTIPTDVTFVDQCAMMEQSMEMMKRFAPAGGAQ